MTRRTALAAASLVAALVAGWAATSGASRSPVVANRAAESIVLGIMLPFALFVIVVGAVISVWLLLKRRFSTGDGAVVERRSRRSHVLAMLAPAVTIALVVLVIYLTRSHVHTHPAAGLAQARGTARSGASVPVSEPAFGATSLVLVALLAFFVVRRRIGLLRGRPKLAPANATADASLQETTGFAAGDLTRAPADLGDPADEPDPRRAIVLAYRRFSALMAAHGIDRAEHETVFEYSDRVVAAPRFGQIRPETTGLTSIFSAARYGSEPPSGSDRVEAIDLLRVIRTELETP